MDVIGSLAALCTLSIVVPSGAQARGRDTPGRTCRQREVKQKNPSSIVSSSRLDRSCAKNAERLRMVFLRTIEIVPFTMSPNLIPKRPVILWVLRASAFSLKLRPGADGSARQ
jgi:hypothetical protein